MTLQESTYISPKQPPAQSESTYVLPKKPPAQSGSAEPDAVARVNDVGIVDGVDVVFHQLGPVLVVTARDGAQRVSFLHLVVLRRTAQSAKVADQKDAGGGGQHTSGRELAEQPPESTAHRALKGSRV